MRTLRVLSILLLAVVMFDQADAQLPKNGKPINLLDKDLTYWYKWLGVPHHTVTGLPPGTPTGDGMNGIPLGLQDPKGVFSVVDLNGEKVLKVTGEIYGGLTTKAEYGNYHFQLKYKWGTKVWEPRLTLPKDGGIMFHLTGANEDAFWSVYMMGMEFQISEGTSGDLFLVPNKTFSAKPIADVRVNKDGAYDARSPQTEVGLGSKFMSVGRARNFESPASEWTTMDLYTVGNTAIYMVNGHIVNVFQHAGLKGADNSVTPLEKGKIQLQSEGAELYYKDITIQAITDYPADLKAQAGLTAPMNWKLGVALYTFMPQSLEDQLAYAKSTGLSYVEGFAFGKAGAALKDSMIFMLSPSGIRQLKDRIDKSGLRMESMYMIGGPTIADWKRDFELAKGLGLKYITAEPPLDLLNSVDSLAGLYGIKVALHNHWKGMSRYWHPDSVLAALKGHPNFGACPDLGHYPKSGIVPEEALKKLAGKIIAIHLKDIAAFGDNTLKDVVVGKGVVSFPKAFEELKRQGFNGHIIIERDTQEKPDNLASVNQTVAYVTQTLGLPTIEPMPVASNKPRRHSGVFNFKPGVTEAEKASFFKALGDLKNIPGVQDLQLSRQVSPNTRFDYGFSMNFADEETYRSYTYHPLHTFFVRDYWVKYVENFMEIDTELL